MQVPTSEDDLRSKTPRDVPEIWGGVSIYDNHHCHNKPQTGNWAGVWMTSCPEEMGWEFGRFWKRFRWGSTMVLRSRGPTMVLRSWSLTMQLRMLKIMSVWGWYWTLQAINWVSGVWRIEFSTVAAAVKIFGSLPTEILNITRYAERWGQIVWSA